MTTQAEAFKEIRDDIAAFDKECEADEYTDTGDAWDLFQSIRNICERELKNIIDSEEVEVNEFRMFYKHCDTEWDMEWSCTCNDRCPVCNHEIEPYEFMLIEAGIREPYESGSHPVENVSASR